MDLIIENQQKINHRLDMLEQTGKAIDTPKSRIPYPQCLIQNKNVPWHIREVTCDNLHLHASTQIFRSTDFSVLRNFIQERFYYGC